MGKADDKAAKREEMVCRETITNRGGTHVTMDSMNGLWCKSLENTGFGEVTGMNNDITEVKTDANLSQKIRSGRV